MLEPDTKRKALSILLQEYDDYQPSNDELSPLCSQLTLACSSYTNEEIIAKGGMKTISKVFCTGTQRYVAKATLNDNSLPDMHDAFIREARLTALLDHPNIIKIHEIALSENGTPYFTMELKTGQSLSEMLNNEETRPCSSASLSDHLGIFIKICDAMAYAHSRKILHLDLKPENIQVGSFGEVIVCDWGLGKIIDSEAIPTTEYEFNADVLNHCTLFGEVKGTPGYMAPEQINNNNKTTATDIYALGAILFSMLAPLRLQHKTVETMLEENADGIPPNLSTKSFGIPSSLHAVIQKAMQKKPKDRYHSVELLRDEIQQYLEGYPTDAEGAGFTIQCTFFWKRNRRICQVIMSSLIIIITGLTFFMARLSESKSRAVAALEDVQRYTDELERVMKLNLEQEESLKSISGEIVSDVVSDYKRYRYYLIQTSPEITIKASNESLEALLKIQPDNIDINHTLNINYFVSMDFDKMIALKNSGNWKSHYWDEFIEKIRLHTDKNSFEVFKIMMKHIENRPSMLTEMVIAYNAKKFQYHPEFPDAVAELVYRSHPEEGKVKLIRSGSTIRFIGPKSKTLRTSPTRLSALRHLRFKELIIENSSIPKAAAFAGLPVVNLDIRGTKIQNLEPLTWLPALSNIRVRKGQITEEQLKKYRMHFNIQVD